MSAQSQSVSNGTTLDAESRERLTTLLERGPEIEYLLDAFGKVLKRSPAFADNVNRAVGDVRGKVSGETGGFDRLTSTIAQLERLSASPSFNVLVDRLQDPETARSLDGLIERLGRIDSMLSAIDRFLVRAPHFADNVNSLVRQVRAQDTGRAAEAVRELGSIDPRQLVQLLNDLFVVVESPQTRALLRSSVFLDQSVALVDEAAKSAVEATGDAAAASGTVSIFGLLSIIKQPDIQRALQFGIAFARRFGQKLGQSRPS